MSAMSSSDVDKHLPPKRTKPATTPVNPPGSNISFNKFIYILAFLALLMSLFYTYRITSWKNEAGGWINLALGKRPDEPIINTHSSSRTTAAPVSLEAKLRALADELGIHPRELASALKPLLPPASSASIAAASPTGSVVGVLAEGTEDNDGPSAFERVAGLGGLVGNEEPFEEA